MLGLDCVMYLQESSGISFLPIRFDDLLTQVSFIYNRSLLFFFSPLALGDFDLNDIIIFFFPSKFVNSVYFHPFIISKLLYMVLFWSLLWKNKLNIYIYIYIYINKALRIVNRLRKIGKRLNLGDCLANQIW